MSGSKRIKGIFLILIFALLLYSPGNLALAGDGSLWGEDGFLSPPTYSAPSVDVDFNDGGQTGGGGGGSAPSNPAPSQPAPVFTPTTSVWDGTQSFRISNIGDSYQDNSAIRSIYTNRLTDPNFAHRSIPGPTSPVFHGFAGQRVGKILKEVKSQNLGAPEGVNFVLIQGGTNDINLDRSKGVDEIADRIRNDIQSIINEVLNGNYDAYSRPAIIVSAIPPMLDPSLTDKAIAVADRLVNTLDKVDIITTANLWDLYDASSNSANVSFMSDNLHTNFDGSYRVAENWFESVDALFNPARIANDPNIYAGNWYFTR